VGTSQPSRTATIDLCDDSLDPLDVVPATSAVGTTASTLDHFLRMCDGHVEEAHTVGMCPFNQEIEALCSVPSSDKARASG
jgi:hypothetical protein